MEREVDNQVAAPTETRTPNLHRVNKNRSSKSADGRVATVATSAGEENLDQPKNKRTHLTPTGLLMEGHCTQNHPAGQDLLGVESLDDIAKDHVTHSDRRADDSGQNKVQTADDR